MPKLPLRELEEAFKNPSAYRAKLEQSAESMYGATYFGALRDAILKYHKYYNDTAQTRAYLEVRLNRFNDSIRSSETMEQLEWYIEDYVSRGWPMFETRMRVVVPLPQWAPPDLICSGEIARVDIVPAGGYAAWLMRSRGGDDWSRELRMPLIQYAVAESILKVPVSEVSIGIYSFAEQFVDLRSYSQPEIDQAHSKLADLLREMGYGA